MDALNKLANYVSIVFVLTAFAACTSTSPPKPQLTQAALATQTVKTAQTTQRIQLPTCESAYLLPENIAQQKIIAIGEIHGTTEIPTAVGQLACSFLQQGKQVMVGLELHSKALAEMLRYQSSEKTSADKAALMTSVFWNKARQDGRASQAMADLISQLQHYKKIGLPVEVFAFDELTLAAEAELKSSTSEMHIVLIDKSMADNTEREIARAPDRVFILYAGNTHASKRNTLEDPLWRSMANRLTDKHVFTSFSANSEGGTAWVCNSGICGPREMMGTATNATAPFIRIDENSKMAKNPAFDGTLFIGSKITASPPFVHSLK